MRIKTSNTFLNGRFVSNQVITFENDRIASIDLAKPTDTDILRFDADSYLIPGMLDLHIHGANGADVMDAMPDSLHTISTTLAAEGVTGFLATTMTESTSKIAAALCNIKQYVHSERATGARILGAHLEGPFLSHKYMGAQCGGFLLDPDTKLLLKWQEDAGGLIKLLTLAPELPNAVDFIRQADKLGIAVSIGHTAASFRETETAIAAGAHHATHLFNAMSGVHHREPGAAAAILYDDRVTAELIADGHHVVPEMLRLAVKCKGITKLILVTDAMRAKCLKSGEYDLGGQNVIVANGTARLKKNQVLAGSILRLNQALANFIDFTGRSLEECIPMVTETPAKILKLDHEIGSLAPSKKADLVVLNNKLDVLMTMREGQIIYKRK